VSSEQRLWRIATEGPSWRTNDLSGQGAANDPGRWNSLGLPVIYASTSIALACLETVVHVTGDQGLPLHRWLVAIDVPAEYWQQRLCLEPAELPGWDATPAERSSMGWGDRWLRGQSGLIALVPSVIVPEECNALINPAHPGAGSLVATVIRSWTYDSRLV
jgi:RES domain-containing protein